MSTETMVQPRTALIATRNSLRRDYLSQDEAVRRAASLCAGWTVRQGEICTEYGTWPVRCHGWRHVTAVDSDRPLVRLEPVGALAPETELDVGWVITRNRRAYQSTLTRDLQTMLLPMPAQSARRCELTGRFHRGY